MMAHASMHARNDSGVSVHSLVVRADPPSPTLTNPDLIVPIEPWQAESDFEGPHPLLDPEIQPSQMLSKPSLVNGQRRSGTSQQVVNNTVAFIPSTISHATHIDTYSGYEHGAPLSDIYEESEATATPTKSTIRSHSTTPPQSPTPVNEQSSILLRPSLRHKKRNSSLSTSSGGSDVGDWEDFDTAKVLSSRVAADLEQMRRNDTLEVEDVSSRRQSREEEELAALNARAERILANARKRLTNMEDNLKTARNSVLIPSKSSPHLGDHQQPVGGLYRSISAAGASKLGKRPMYPPIKTSSSLQHIRGGSDISVLNSTKRFSRTPEVRAASAMEYGSPARYSLFPDTTPSPSNRFQPSPTSSKGLNPSLPTLGEEHDSPSTISTTPDSVRAPLTRGLGILTSAGVSRDNLVATLDHSSLRQTPTPTQHVRASSSTSIRSTQSLKDQMTDLKSRIADLKSKTQAENFKRQSLQSLRSSSPYTPGPLEQYYASSPAYEETGSPINANAGIGLRLLGKDSPVSPRVMEMDGQEDYDLPPFTPAKAKLLSVEHMTPNTEAQILSSIRTDRNDPSLAQNGVSSAPIESEDDVESVVQASHYQDASNGLEDSTEDEHEVEQIAENEEEQVYLNEVLEESLREAEVEPDVPIIPGSFLPSPDGIPTVIGPEAERHEDRIDAFDYENMFLHSAMGTYTGRSLSGSDSGSEPESDGDTGSVETSRMDARTPIDESDRSAEFEPNTEDETDAMKRHEKTFASNVDHRSLPKAGPAHNQRQLYSPPLMLPQPPKPWAHIRNNSVDSVSTADTFETAAEGGEEDAGENPMLNWDPAPSSSLGYSPTSHQVYYQKHSPVHPRHGFSSPRNGGRSSAMPKQFPSPPKALYENNNINQAQYIDNQSTSGRVHTQDSSNHARQSSIATMQPYYRPGSVATVKAVSPIKSPTGIQTQQNFTGPSRTPPTPSSSNSRSLSGSAGSPVLVTVSSSPQRKVVINRSLQHPQSYILEPQLHSPPDIPLPDPPALASSAILQAQLQSPKQVNIKSPRRSTSTQKRNTPTTPPQRDFVNNTQAPGPVPNTEILMESLIKLADPNFTLAPGMMFADIDKELVLGLLRAVGSVVDGVLRAGDEKTALTLRGRLEGATSVLEGVEVRNNGERMREV